MPFSSVSPQEATSFAGQERAIYVAAFSLSVLAGYGLAVLPSLADRLRRILGWGLFGAALAGASVFLVFWLLPHRADIAVSKFFLIGALALLFAAAFAMLCGAKRVTRTVLLLFLPLLVSNLLLVNFSTNLTDGPGVRSLLDRREATATLEAALELARDGSGPRPRVYNEFRLPDSSGLFVGWEDVWGSSPMRLFFYDSLFHDFPLHRLWELTGVGTVLTWREELPVASRLLEEFPGKGETDRIHALEVVSPRWWWAQKARRNVADRDAPGLLADPNFDPQERDSRGRIRRRLAWELLERRPTLVWKRRFGLAARQADWPGAHAIRSRERPEGAPVCQRELAAWMAGLMDG